VWNAHPWAFKRVKGATWYATTDGTPGGTPTATPMMPTAFARARLLFDENGNEVQELPPDEFERVLAPVSATGTPEAWTTVGRQIWLGPAPAAGYKLTLSYRRRLATRTAALTVREGFFVAGDDVPLWDDHHYLLVMRAKLIGLRDRSDPTADDLEGEFARMLEAMKEEYGEKNSGVTAPGWP
jgi:hypothetical protein